MGWTCELGNALLGTFTQDLVYLTELDQTIVETRTGQYCNTIGDAGYRPDMIYTVTD